MGENAFGFSRKELGDRAEQLVAAYCGGTLAPSNTPGWDLESPAYGRVQVKARCRSSRYLNWFHIRNVERREFDYLVLIEFEPDLSVVGAWGMRWEQVGDFAHSVVRSARGHVTKLAVRGDWKQRADRLAI